MNVGAILVFFFYLITFFLLFHARAAQQSGRQFGAFRAGAEAARNVRLGPQSPELARCKSIVV